MENIEDQKYLKIMSAYKKARRDPSKIEESTRMLQAASLLARMGNVSEDAITAAQYM